MVRGVLVAVLIAGLGVALALVVPRWMAMQEDSAISDAKDDCYPLQQVCEWQTPAGTAQVVMERLEGDELGMQVTLPGASDRVIVVLTGESMYMGEYPLRMQHTAESGRYRVRFVPPFCSTGNNMVWRINLRDGADAINVPLQLLFRSHES